MTFDAEAYGYETRHLGGLEDDTSPATVAVGFGATAAPALTLPASDRGRSSMRTKPT